MILVFTDTHDDPDINQDRFSWLGEVMADKQPEVIVQLGDFLSMGSLSRWDRDKRLKIEGRRYLRDMESGRSALGKIMRPVYDLQQRQRRLKKKTYDPTIYWFEGNHEYWIRQYTEYSPEMDGQIGLQSDLGLPDNWNFVPYPDNICIQDIYFTHIPHTKGGALMSPYICQRALEMFEGSVVFGHTHEFQLATKTRFGGNQYTALNAGCLFDETPDYAIGKQNNYWKGIFLIEPQDGSFDLQTLQWRN